MRSGNLGHASEHSPFPSWQDVASDLVAVAAGRAPADLVLRDARVVLVQTREVMDGWHVAVSHGRFAYVGPDASAIASARTRRWRS